MGKDLLKIAIISLIVYNIIPVINKLVPGTENYTFLIDLWIINIIYSVACGLIYGNKYRFKISIPIVIAIMFIPTMLIFYDTSEYIYIIAYFVAAVIGCILGQFAYDRNNE